MLTDAGLSHTDWSSGAQSATSRSTAIVREVRLTACAGSVGSGECVRSARSVPQPALTHARAHRPRRTPLSLAHPLGRLSSSSRPSHLTSHINVRLHAAMRGSRQGSLPKQTQEAGWHARDLERAKQLAQSRIPNKGDGACADADRVRAGMSLRLVFVYLPSHVP